MLAVPGTVVYANNHQTCIERLTFYNAVPYNMHFLDKSLSAVFLVGIDLVRCPCVALCAT